MRGYQRLYGRNPISGNANQGERTMADATPAASTARLTTAKGKTRGKNPRDIEYKKFDLEQPETLPKTLAEFMEVTGVKAQDEILSYVIDGFNAAQYSAASDEIGEFIPDHWDKETSNQFRLAVRNTSKLANLDIETVVKMLMPAVEKGLAEKKAAAEKEKAQPVGA